ncbi:hypothetical protein GALMADRAFT_146487 [Galerina marginata CBS 339.88]|uniref:Uncharacterized protein n=1 Tax=Galerina marginata (strain CBS 339.88) TaxID=685588 RepID=A0A067SBK8_GALM3|nr:hypothetical protein GALMADRAFT_146487 [Galerina marginata CBS 339.88]
MMRSRPHPSYAISTMCNNERTAYARVEARRRNGDDSNTNWERTASNVTAGVGSEDKGSRKRGKQQKQLAQTPQHAAVLLPCATTRSGQELSRRCFTTTRAQWPHPGIRGSDVRALCFPWPRPPIASYARHLVTTVRPMHLHLGPDARASSLLQPPVTSPARSFPPVMPIRERQAHVLAFGTRHPCIKPPATSPACYLAPAAPIRNRQARTQASGSSRQCTEPPATSHAHYFAPAIPICDRQADTLAFSHLTPVYRIFRKLALHPFADPDEERLGIVTGTPTRAGWGPGFIGVRVWVGDFVPYTPPYP